MVWPVLVGGLLVWSGAGAGWAVDPDQPDPNRHYWYEEQQVAQAQAEGITGEGVPVAVIDLGIWTDMPELADAHLTVREPSFCGEEYFAGRGEEPFPAVQPISNTSARMTFIVGNGRNVDGDESVQGVAPGADVRFYAVGAVSVDSVCNFLDPELDANEAAATARAIVQAVDDGARIIVLYDQDPGFELEDQADWRIAEAVAYAVHEKVVVVVPSSSVFGGTWIQALNGVVSVAAVAKDGSTFGATSDTTVLAPGVDVLFPGERKDSPHNLGTSLEVPAWLVAGMLADVAQKWPEATGDQLIQTLVTNTVPQVPSPPGKEEDRSWKKYGYGLADLPQMLAVDPTQYPDVNPLVVPDDGIVGGLTEQEIRTAVRPAWARPVPSAEPTPAAVPSNSPGRPRWVWPALGAAVVVTVTGVMAARTWSVARRRSRRDPDAEQDVPATEWQEAPSTKKEEE